MSRLITLALAIVSLAFVAAPVSARAEESPRPKRKAAPLQ